MGDPLEAALAWTDAELSWIESVGGYVYETTQAATDDQITSQADDFYTTSDIATSAIDKVSEQVEDDNNSLWDTIWDGITSGYEWIEDKAIDAYNWAKDWVTGHTNSQADDFYTIVKGITAILNTETTIQADDFYTTVRVAAAAVEEEIDKTANKSWWENLAFDFPEFSLEPLAGILGKLTDNIGGRIERFIANAFDIKYKGK